MILTRPQKKKKTVTHEFAYNCHNLDQDLTNN